MNWKIIAIILIVGLTCFGAGFSAGSFTTADFIIEKSIKYFAAQNITIPVEKQEFIYYFKKFYGFG